MRLYLFDFDGTLTTRDSLFAFLKFVSGPVKFWLGVVLFFPLLVLVKARWLNASGVKERLIAFHLKGRTQAELDTQARQFCRKEVPGMLRANAMAYLREAVAGGHSAALVSASMDTWLAPFAEAEGMTLICTQAAYSEGKFTGRFASANCHGAEKARRVRAQFALEKYDEVYAFGDSRGDREMLEMASHPHFRFFEGK